MDAMQLTKSVKEAFKDFEATKWACKAASEGFEVAYVEFDGA